MRLFFVQPRRIRDPNLMEYPRPDYAEFETHRPCKDFHLRSPTHCSSSVSLIQEKNKAMLNGNQLTRRLPSESRSLRNGVLVGKCS